MALSKESVWVPITVHYSSQAWQDVSFLLSYYYNTIGPGSSVGILNDYGLDGPGSNPGEGEIFRSSIPALGPTEPPVEWVSVISRG